MDGDTDTAAPVMIGNMLPQSWVSRVDLKLIADSVGTPVFVYSEDQLLRNVGRITSAAEAAGLADRVELFVPFFPNSNPHVLQPLQEAGVGLLLQVPGEYRILRQFGFDKFIVSPGHVADEEIDFWSATGYPTFLGSLSEVEHALRTNAPSISARIDSLDSGKPGIKYGELGRLSDLLKEYDRDLECFEVYCGSGNSLDEMSKIIETMFEIFNTHFPTSRSINFAGGHGFVYESWDETEKHFDWGRYFLTIRDIADRMGVPEHVAFLFEPARDVLADTGVLLMGVKRDVITNPVFSLVVTDGSRMLMPSAQLRDRRHNVAFLDAEMREICARNTTDGVYAAVRGRTILRHDYILPGHYWVPTGVDAESYMLVLDVGAYCATQHMEFLNVPPAAEVLVNTDGSAHLITSRGDDLDKWRNLLAVKKELSK
ncbi:diaminopimelate decarboxylase [Allocatelliglobosispora scoriae]|uniref:Diaminopimelate decarboxylase n=1 Tax=Allocatelliglobosispora scoriae TaxID=643052 RepID=A0A841BKE5_9ACTN|nr:diaminopimelate decarboxylase [Allocatelliglobosispora scoriae]MBB5868744.1 diaminopimelate decarboxylase [Allocatelliglobosispora scoriae]